MGWGQCPWWPGEAHTNLWGLQCQPKSPCARQLVGHSLPVPTLGSTGVCHIAFLGAWLRQPAIAVTHLQRNTYSVLQTGRQPERAGEDLGSWGETQHWTCSIAIILQFCSYLQSKNPFTLILGASYSRPCEDYMSPLTSTDKPFPNSCPSLNPRYCSTAIYYTSQVVFPIRRGDERIGQCATQPKLQFHQWVNMGHPALVVQGSSKTKLSQ